MTGSGLVPIGCTCGRRFASFGLRPLALPLRWLSANAASLHVAPCGGFTTMPNPRQILAFAPWQDARFGSKADMCTAKAYVRFAPKSGHVQCTSACLLWANSGHCCRIEIIRKCMVDRQDERKAAIHR
jgi:hypothetical protein